jgi:hypothetical protein
VVSGTLTFVLKGIFCSLISAPPFHPQKNDLNLIFLMVVAGVTFVRLVRVLESPLGSGRPADVSEEPQ